MYVQRIVKPLLVPAAFGLVMVPLLSVMLTSKLVLAEPEATDRISSHALLSVVDSVSVHVTPATLDCTLKSAAVTPVTSPSNVAVNFTTEFTTTVPLGPWLDENVGVGGVYLQAHA